MHLSVVFFFNQKTAYEMRISDWSSDVCSSYLVDAVDQHIVAVTVLVGEAPCDHPSDNRLRIRFPGSEQAPPDPRSLEIAGGQFALHGADDVAALAKRAQRPLQIVGELPATTADILGEAHAGELLQPPGPERLLKRVAIQIGRAHV